MCFRRRARAAGGISPGCVLRHLRPGFVRESSRPPSNPLDPPFEKGKLGVVPQGAAIPSRIRRISRASRSRGTGLVSTAPTPRSLSRSWVSPSLKPVHRMTGIRWAHRPHRPTSDSPLSRGIVRSVITRSNRAGSSLKDAERLLAARRRGHRVAERLEALPQHRHDLLLVVHHQHPLRAPRRLALRLPADPLRPPALDHRQVDVEARPHAGLAVDLDRPARLGDDPVDDREPEPGPLARRLRREVRLEDPVPDLRRHPRAGVAHRENDVPPPRQVLHLRLQPR